jgi:hypothetical protein
MVANIARLAGFCSVSDLAAKAMRDGSLKIDDC